MGIAIHFDLCDGATLYYQLVINRRTVIGPRYRTRRFAAGSRNSVLSKAAKTTQWQSGGKDGCTYRRGQGRSDLEKAKTPRTRRISRWVRIREQALLTKSSTECAFHHSHVVIRRRKERYRSDDPGSIIPTRALLFLSVSVSVSLPSVL